jgi:plasmid replication initiation protein
MAKRKLAMSKKELKERRRMTEQTFANPAMDESGVTVVARTEKQLEAGRCYWKNPYYAFGKDFTYMIFRLNEIEGKLFRFMITKLHNKKDKFFKRYFLNLREFQSMLPGGDTNVSYLLMEKNYINLISNVVKSKSRKYVGILQVPIIRIAKVEGKPILEFRFNPELRRHLLQLSENYVKCDIRTICKLKGKYSVTIYEILKCNAFKGETVKVEIDMDYLRKLTGSKNVTEIYETIEYVKNQIDKHTDLKIKSIKKSKGRRIKGITITFTKKEDEPSREVKRIQEELDSLFGKEPRHLKSAMNIIREYEANYKNLLIDMGNPALRGSIDYEPVMKPKYKNVVTFWNRVVKPWLESEMKPGKKVDGSYISSSFFSENLKSYLDKTEKENV